MGANGKWDFLIPVTIAAAALLGQPGELPSNQPAHGASEVSAQLTESAPDNLVLEPAAAQVLFADHESHSSHQSHTSHQSHSSHKSHYSGYAA